MQHTMRNFILPGFEAGLGALVVGLVGSVSGEHAPEWRIVIAVLWAAWMISSAIREAIHEHGRSQ